MPRNLTIFENSTFVQVMVCAIREQAITWATVDPDVHDDFIKLKHFPHYTGPLCGEFTGHRWIPHTKASDVELWWVFFYLRLNKWLSKQSWGWWFETPSRPLWCHCNNFAILQLLATMIVKSLPRTPVHILLSIHVYPPGLLHTTAWFP